MDRSNMIPCIKSVALFATFMAFILSDALRVTSLETDLIICEKANIETWVPHEDDPISLPNATLCDIGDPNSASCERVLGNNTLVTRCLDTETGAQMIFPNSMTTVFLANISLAAIEPLAFTNVIFGGITEMFLHNNSLISLAEGTFQGLDHLETLNLFSNVLQELHPRCFEGLPSLTTLLLYDNHLTILEANTFIGLTQLEELDLAENKLTTIHSGVLNDLLELLLLNFDSNQIKEIPVDLFNVSRKMESIDFDKNLLEELPVGLFEGLTELTEIDLDKNLITEIHPNVFRGLVNLEEIELDNNKLTLIPTGVFDGLSKLKGLTISHNDLEEFEPGVLRNLSHLIELHLQFNNLTSLDPEVFTNVPKLEILYINHNRLGQVHSDLFKNLSHLRALSLAHNDISNLPDNLFDNMANLNILNISRNNLDRLPSGVFDNFKSLVILDLTHNPLLWVNGKTFKKLKEITTLYVDHYATCCFIQEARCSFESPRSPFLSCKRLLPYSILRAAIWLLGIGSICGNLFVLYTRCRRRSTRSKVQFFLITNLSLSDLLMGVYLITMLIVDMQYNVFFPSHSESWRHSDLCRFVGMLSILSSEASVFFITLISFDRFMGVKYPFSSGRLRKTSARIVAGVLWSIALLIGIASILIPIVSPNLYDASEICVGLPISRVNSYAVKEVTFKLNTSELESGLQFGRAVEAVFIGSTASMYFSIAIFTGLNLLCFLFVAFCYVEIFVEARKVSRSAGRTSSVDDEMRMALKMAGVVCSDFCCWMVVVVLSILVQSSVVTIDPVAYAWIATFIMPINSCLNPFLYTLSSLISERVQRSKLQNPTNDSTMTGISTISKTADAGM